MAQTLSSIFNRPVKKKKTEKEEPLGLHLGRNWTDTNLSENENLFSGSDEDFTIFNTKTIPSPKKKRRKQPQRKKNTKNKQTSNEGIGIQLPIQRDFIKITENVVNTSYRNENVNNIISLNLLNRNQNEHAYGSTDESTGEESTTQKSGTEEDVENQITYPDDFCFLCNFYSCGLEAPIGPVKTMLTSLESLFANAGSDIESISYQISKYYETEIYFPCKERGTILPPLSKDMVMKHILDHICHDPQVHLYTSFVNWKRIQNLIFDRCVFKLRGVDDDSIYFDHKLIELLTKIQLILSKIQHEDPKKSVFGRDLKFDLSKKNSFMNSRTSQAAMYQRKCIDFE